MKAIVLTCDKYHPFADHMIHRYMHLWPENPFTFMVPYQNYPDHLKKKYGEKIRLIETNSDIKSTMKTLLSHTDDEEWVYWCMDDRYPLEIDTERLTGLFHWINNMDSKNVSGILFTYRMSKFTNKYVLKHSRISDSEKNTYAELVNYSFFWYHQFMKSKILGRFTEHLPDYMQQAKQMDAIKDNLALAGGVKRFVRIERLASFGESTNRGEITQNCLKSMEYHHLNIPSDFPILNKEIVTGSRKYERSVLYYNVRSLYRKVMGIES